MTAAVLDYLDELDELDVDLDALDDLDELDYAENVARVDHLDDVDEILAGLDPELVIVNDWRRGCPLAYLGDQLDDEPAGVTP